MKRSTLLTALLMAVCCLLFASQARANSTTIGSSIISYDPNTDTITATGITHPDYFADDYYESRVVCWLRDGNDNVIDYGAATDVWGAGYASVTLQYTGTDPGTQYTIKSLHGFILEVQDPSYLCGCYFDDYYNYGFYENQGIDEENCFTFLGNGPIVVRHSSSLPMANTHASTSVPSPTVSSLQASLPSTKNAATGSRPAAGTFTTTNNSISFANASTTDMAVLLQSAEIQMTVTAQGVNPTSVSSQLKWRIDRDSSDTVATGLPTLSAAAGAQITVTPSVAGNFNLTCYYDINKNGAYDSGEELKVLHLAVVRTQVLSDSTIDSAVQFSSILNGNEMSVSTDSGGFAMSLTVSVLLEGGGADRRIGVSKIHLGDVGNLASDSTFLVNYPGNVAGTAAEDPGGQVPMLDADLGVGGEASGGSVVFRLHSSDHTETGVSDGEERTVSSTDNPSFGPFKIVHPQTQNTWATTAGGYDFIEYIAAYSDTFQRYYAALAKATWAIRYVGQRDSSGAWIDTGSSGVTLQGTSDPFKPVTVIVTNGSPQSGDAAGIQVLGKGYVNSFKIVYTPAP